MSGGWVALGELAAILGGLAALFYFVGRDGGNGTGQDSSDSDGGGDGGGD